MNEYDLVKVKYDIPEKKLTKDMVGTILLVLEKPKLAYEVEFCNEEGETIISTALLPEEIEKVENDSVDN